MLKVKTGEHIRMCFGWKTKFSERRDLWFEFNIPAYRETKNLVMTLILTPYDTETLVSLTIEIYLGAKKN